MLSDLGHLALRESVFLRSNHGFKSNAENVVSDNRELQVLKVDANVKDGEGEP